MGPSNGGGGVPFDLVRSERSVRGQRATRQTKESLEVNPLGRKGDTAFRIERKDLRKRQNVYHQHHGGEGMEPERVKTQNLKKRGKKNGLTPINRIARATAARLF